MEKKKTKPSGHTLKLIKTHHAGLEVEARAVKQGRKGGALPVMRASLRYSLHILEGPEWNNLRILPASATLIHHRGPPTKRQISQGHQVEPEEQLLLRAPRNPTSWHLKHLRLEDDFPFWGPASWRMFRKLRWNFPVSLVPRHVAPSDQISVPEAYLDIGWVFKDPKHPKLSSLHETRSFGKWMKMKQNWHTINLGRQPTKQQLMHSSVASPTFKPKRKWIPKKNSPFA